MLYDSASLEGFDSGLVLLSEKDTNNYFISEVYSIMNSGYYKKYLVFKETDLHKLVDCFKRRKN